MHRVLAVEQALVHVDVDHLRARLGLRARNLERLVVVAVEDELLELGRAGDVAPLADVQEAEVLVDGERLEPRDAHLAKVGLALPRLPRAALAALGEHLVERLDVLRRGAAAASEHVDEPRLHKVLERQGEALGRLVVAAHGVGQPRVRVRVHKALGHAVERLDEGHHVGGAEGAVEPDAERLGVLHRDVEGLGGLAGERAPRHVHHGAGDDHGQPRAAGIVVVLVDGGERSLRVERVEDGLDHEDVAAAVDQAGHLPLVRREHLVPRAVARARVLHRRRDREGAVGRANGAGDEAGTVRLRRGHLLGGVDGELGADLVQLVDDVFHVVVRLPRSWRGRRHGAAHEGGVGAEWRARRCGRRVARGARSGGRIVRCGRQAAGCARARGERSCACAIVVPENVLVSPMSAPATK